MLIAKITFHKRPFASGGFYTNAHLFFWGFTNTVYASRTSEDGFTHLGRHLWKNSCLMLVLVWFCPSFYDLVLIQTVIELFGTVHYRSERAVAWLIAAKLNFANFLPVLLLKKPPSFYNKLASLEATLDWNYDWQWPTILAGVKCRANIATGESSQAITPFHFFDNSNFHH